MSWYTDRLQGLYRRLNMQSFSCDGKIVYMEEAEEEESGDNFVNGVERGAEE
jgi:hypothetical protein